MSNTPLGADAAAAPERDLARTTEDEDPLAHVGEVADAPADTAPAPDDGEAERAWRLATSLRDLRAEVDARWPHRDRTSDGSIGDENHIGTKSDHNPNAAGVVRAIDIDVDGIAAAWLAEHLRQRGAVGDTRIHGGGYVIFNARIASDVGNWAWRKYNGSNPHRSHIHVSASLSAAGYDASRPWGIWNPLSGSHGPIPLHERGSRLLRLAEPPMRGTDVEYVQRWTGAAVTGSFDVPTDARVRRYQQIVGLLADGIVGRDTWRAMKVENTL